MTYKTIPIKTSNLNMSPYDSSKKTQMLPSFVHKQQSKAQKFRNFRSLMPLSLKDKDPSLSLYLRSKDVDPVTITSKELYNYKLQRNRQALK